MPSNPAARGTVLDRIIGWIDPHAGLRRQMGRRLLQRAYDAASPRDPWKPKRSGASANADHFADAAMLRAKARALVQNVPYIAAGMDALVAQTVGTGIVPRATGGQADLINTLWARWVTECDADGRLDFYGLTAAAYRAMEQDGEVLIRLRPRFATDGLSVPLQLQLLEIDWLDTSRISAEGSNTVVNGVEYDTLGRVVAYWLWDQHPGDITLRRGTRTQSRRVPASSIIHLYRQERPGQGRGITRLAPIISRVRDLQLYEDAVLARKNLESRLSVLASGDVTQMANPEPGALAGDPSKAAQTGSLGELASGGITQLPPGLNLQFIDPKSAGGEVAYVVYQLHLIAAGFGVSYEMMTGDLSQVNYSSARVRLMDLRRQIEQMQWLTLVPNLLGPIWRAFNDAAELAGKIRRPDYKVDYSTPKWEYVNPEQDVRAELDAVGGGLQSLSESIRRRGYNPAQVFEELRTDFETLKESGVLEVLLLLQRGRVSQDVTPQPTGAASTAK
jgi:lambda family phage portal protein